MDIVDKMYQNKEYIKIKEKSDKVKNIETNNIRLLNNYTVSLFVPIKYTTLKLIKVKIYIHLIYHFYFLMIIHIN